MARRNLTRLHCAEFLDSSIKILNLMSSNLHLQIVFLMCCQQAPTQDQIRKNKYTKIHFVLLTWD